MAFVSELFDQLRDLLNDPSDSQVSFATKKLYLNLGITHMWPRVFRIVTATSIPVVANTWDYNLTAILSEHQIVSIELEEGNAEGTYQRMSRYDILPGDEDTVSVLRLKGVLPEAGANIRIRHTQPVANIVASTYAAAGSEVWTGPDKFMGIPVMYAMGLISVRRMEDYLDATRRSTDENEQRRDPSGLMRASDFWMAQYESQVGALSRPLPVAED